MFPSLSIFSLLCTSSTVLIHSLELPIAIPTFSAETDWISPEALHNLSIAVETYGFAYFEMSEELYALYESIIPNIYTFFRHSADWPSHSLPNQDLNFSVWRAQNIFYGYVNYQVIEPYQQCRCFMMPTQSTPIDVLHHPSNPFTQHNDDILTFTTILNQYATKLLYHIIAYIMQNAEDSHAECTDYFHQILGSNPAVHFGVNYFNANELTIDMNHGIVDHTDSDFISLLAADGDGLQIEFENEWIDIEYRPGRMIVNFGTMLELLTDGKVKAVKHRVKLVEDGERVSFGIFLNADLDGYVYRFINQSLVPVKTVLKHFQDSFDEYLSES